MKVKRYGEWYTLTLILERMDELWKKSKNFGRLNVLKVNPISSCVWDV